MTFDTEAFADLVVSTIKSAIAPIQERLRVAESQLDAIKAEGVWHSGIEPRLADARERLVTLEAKAAQPPDLSPVLSRVIALETKEMPAARDGVDGAPGQVGEKGLDGAAGPEGPRGLEGPEGKPGRDGRDGLPGVPGSPGEKGLDGKDGADGVNGTDGVDGLAFDDYSVLNDGERTVTWRAHNGTRVKEWSVTFPVVIYRGVYTEGKTYDRGDMVTFGGSLFHCNEVTMSKPESTKAWTLAAKRGRDGKDGVAPPTTTVPVVKVR